MRRQQQNQRVLELIEIHLEQSKTAFLDFKCSASKAKLIKFFRLDAIPQLPGGGWASLDVWVEGGLSSTEVTLEEWTAANLQYADSYCASEPAAAAFCEFGGGSDSVLPSLLGLGSHFTGPLLASPPTPLHPHTQQWHPYVCTLTHKCCLAAQVFA